jgi:transcriptional regulator with GAF, ATPase, and Fis domain
LSDDRASLEVAKAAEQARLAGDPARAKKTARDALSRAKDDGARGILLATIGRAELDQGEAAAAVRTLEEAARLLEGDPAGRAEVELDLGRARRRTGDLDGALKVLAAAAERFRAAGKIEGERRALASRGKALYARGDMKGARAAFRGAVELDGKEPETWRLHHAIARAYEKEGRKADAEKSYNAAREAGWDGRARDADFAASGGALSGLGSLEVDPMSRDLLGPGRSPPPPSSVDAKKSFEPRRADARSEADKDEPSVATLRHEDLVKIVTLTSVLSSSEAPQPLLEMILDRAIEWSGAERGYVVVRHPDPVVPPPPDAPPTRDAISVYVARTSAGQTIMEPEDEVSRSIVREVVLRGEPVISDDATVDTRLAGFTSVAERGVRSVACVPLRQSSEVLGALYLERRDAPGRFGPRERALLEALAHQGAIALDRVLKTTKLEEAYRETRRALDERTGLAFGIIGRARQMRHVFRLIEKVRNNDANILIEGETGTGKELVARAIHSSSLRKEGPFVVESCAALPEGLLEAELFGHEKGAFTGATESRRGAFERSDGGTLFLDEVGDMPARMQALLLRVLETGEVRPLGSPAPRKVDCRVIAAARQDLRSLVRAGRFREDLFFRLNVIRIVVPPLRERKEDIPALSEAFLREIGRPSSALTPRALEYMLKYDWPGNVRELKHAIERSALLASDGPIDARHLGIDLGSQSRAEGPAGIGSTHADAPAPSAGKVSFRGHVLNRRQLALIDYLRANGVATNREYVRLVGVSVPTGWRDLKDLLDKGVIRAEGQGRNTVYRLEEGVKDELGTSTTDGT